jgi:hypothetical protein
MNKLLLIVVVVLTAGFAGFGVWYVGFRNPIATPDAALEAYAEARASRRTGELARYMWVDPVLVPDAAKREEVREQKAREHVSVRESVVGASVNESLSVESTKVVSVNGEQAQGEVIFISSSTRGEQRLTMRVDLAFQDGGWRVSRSWFE